MFNSLPHARKAMKSILEREKEVDPEKLFFNSIKSPATKRAYTIYLQRFMKFAGCKTINGLISDFKNLDLRTSRDDLLSS